MRGGKRDKRRAGEGRKGRLESRDCQRRETEQRWRGIEKPQREKGKNEERVERGKEEEMNFFFSLPCYFFLVFWWKTLVLGTGQHAVFGLWNKNSCPKSKRKSKTKENSEGNTRLFLVSANGGDIFLVSLCPATNPETGGKNELSPQANDNNTENRINISYSTNQLIRIRSSSPRCSGFCTACSSDHASFTGYA